VPQNLGALNRVADQGVDYFALSELAVMLSTVDSRLAILLKTSTSHRLIIIVVV